MPDPSIRDRLAAALEARGWERDLGARTKKFMVFAPKGAIITAACPSTARYFLGRSGALRYDPLGRSSESVPHEHMKARLLAEADKLVVKHL